ncbi:cryptochrome/photolyase family protein [Paenibacillus kandeliae]|uniref:cryptochrome/photolyase family protein n=1 Tax=Paenibacillus kandeliae TaxID=3231269 RepID=UPI00345A4EAF
MKLFIHRKDLRTHDLAGFDYVKEAGDESIHLLIIDPFLLKKHREKEHSGVNFMRHVQRLIRQYQQHQRELQIAYGKPEEVLEYVLDKLDIDEVVAHRDFTPYAKERDRKLRKVAEDRDVAFTLLVDHMMLDVEPFADFTGKNGYYKIFAPFHRKWLDFLDQQPHPVSPVSLKELHVSKEQIDFPSRFEVPFQLDDYEPADDPEPKLDAFLKDKVQDYGEERDYYAIDPSSELNPHLVTGAISIRQMYNEAIRHKHSEEWVRQIAFRDFYLYLAIYDEDYFQYEKTFDLSPLDDRHFEAWYKGETGIPVIDAAMRQLNETGQLHNRLRILSAMFLTKNLQCPFTLGEQYFRRKLLDYDNIINRGNWTWCASLGANSSPYFRVVNPVTQSAKYDEHGDYIRQWLPELKDLSAKEIHQPRPDAIVDLKKSRAAAIETYKQIVNGKK